MCRKIIILALLASCFVLCFAGCSEKGIIGTWVSEDGEEVLIFKDDGSCSVPFTYDGSWWESCDRFSVGEDGELILSSSQGNVGPYHYKKAKNRNILEEESGQYLIDGDLLVFNRYNSTYKYKRK